VRSSEECIRSLEDESEDGFFTCAVSVQHKKHDIETGSTHSNESGKRVVWPANQPKLVKLDNASRSTHNTYKQTIEQSESQPDPPHKWIHHAATGDEEVPTANSRNRVTRSRSRSKNIMERARSFERTAANGVELRPGNSSRPVSRNGSFRNRSNSASASKNQMDDQWAAQIERPSSRTDVDSRRFADIRRVDTHTWEERIHGGSSENIPLRSAPPRRRQEMSLLGQAGQHEDDRFLSTKTPEPPPPPTRAGLSLSRDSGDGQSFPPPPTSSGDTCFAATNQLSTESVNQLSEENKEKIVKEWVESTCHSNEQIQRELEKFAYDIAESVVSTMEKNSDKTTATREQSQAYQSSKNQEESREIYHAVPVSTIQDDHDQVYDHNARVGMTFQQEERRRQELRRQEELQQEERRKRAEEAEMQRVEVQRQEEEARIKQEEIKRQTELKRMEEIRLQEETRKMEEFKRQEEVRKQEFVRRQEEARRLEELRLQEEARRQQEERKRMEEERKKLEAEKLRLEREKQQQEELKQQEMLRYEKLRQEEEAKRQEEIRLEHEMRRQFELHQKEQLKQQELLEQQQRRQEQEKLLQLKQEEMNKQQESMQVRSHLSKLSNTKSFDHSQDKNNEPQGPASGEHLGKVRTGQVHEKRNFWIRSSSADRMGSQTLSPAPRRRKIDGWNCSRQKENDDPDSRPGSSLGQANIGSVKNLTSGFLSKSKSSTAVAGQQEVERGRPRQRTNHGTSWTKERYDQETNQSFLKSNDIKTNKVNDTLTNWGKQEHSQSGRTTPVPSRHIGQVFSENKVAKMENEKNANSWRTKTPEPSVKLVNVSVEKAIGSNQNIHISDSANAQMASYRHESKSQSCSQKQECVMVSSNSQAASSTLGPVGPIPPPTPERNQSFGAAGRYLCQ